MLTAEIYNFYIQNKGRLRFNKWFMKQLIEYYSYLREYKVPQNLVVPVFWCHFSNEFLEKIINNETPYSEIAIDIVMLNIQNCAKTMQSFTKLIAVVVKTWLDPMAAFYNQTLASCYKYMASKAGVIFCNIPDLERDPFAIQE